MESTTGLSEAQSESDLLKLQLAILQDKKRLEEAQRELDSFNSAAEIGRLEARAGETNQLELLEAEKALIQVKLEIARAKLELAGVEGKIRLRK